MAERRMMSKSIIKSDTFLDMPATTQNLYFHMLLDADDDGFINAPKSIMRMIGAKEDDMKVLTAKQFVIPFESGVVVIKDWITTFRTIGINQVHCRNVIYSTFKRINHIR